MLENGAVDDTANDEQQGTESHRRHDWLRYYILLRTIFLHRCRATTDRPPTCTLPPLSRSIPAPPTRNDAPANPRSHNPRFLSGFWGHQYPRFTRVRCVRRELSGRHGMVMPGPMGQVMAIDGGRSVDISIHIRCSMPVLLSTGRAFDTHYTSKARCSVELLAHLFSGAACKLELLKT